MYRTIEVGYYLYLKKLKYLKQVNLTDTVNLAALKSYFQRRLFDTYILYLSL